MLSPGIKENIISELDKLPADLQKKVQDFVQALVISLPKGKPGKSYLEFAGILDKQSTDEITRTIEEGCERVDLNEW